MSDLPPEKTFVLRRPITNGDTTVETITLREPTFSEFKAAKKKANGDELELIDILIQKMGTVGALVTGNLNMRDALDMGDYVMGFFLDRLSGGTTPTDS